MFISWGSFGLLGNSLVQFSFKTKARRRLFNLLINLFDQILLGTGTVSNINIPISIDLYEDVL